MKWIFLGNGEIAWGEPENDGDRDFLSRCQPESTWAEIAQKFSNLKRSLEDESCG